MKWLALLSNPPVSGENTQQRIEEGISKPRHDNIFSIVITITIISSSIITTKIIYAYKQHQHHHYHHPHPTCALVETLMTASVNWEPLLSKPRMARTLHWRSPRPLHTWVNIINSIKIIMMINILFMMMMMMMKTTLTPGGMPHQALVISPTKSSLSPTWQSSSSWSSSS